MPKGRSLFLSAIALIVCVSTIGIVAAPSRSDSPFLDQLRGLIGFESQGVTLTETAPREIVVGSAPFAAPTSIQDFGTSTASQTSQTGSAAIIPNPTSGTTWARAGATAPNAPVLLQTASNPLGTTGAYVRGVASTSTSVTKFSPWIGYTSGTEFYSSFKVLLGDATGGNSATTGSWSFYQGAGAMYSDANDFSGAQVFTGLRFTYGAGGAIALTYRAGSSFVTTNLTNSTLASATVYNVEIVGNNKTTGSITYTYNGTSQSVAVQKFDLYINGVLIGDDLAEAALPAGSAINSGTFIGISSTANAANIFVDDAVTYNAVPAAIGTAPASPTVTSISPTSGTTAGGTTVTITGTNLSNATSVKFGATTAPFSTNTATQIVATSPAGSAGTVDVTVTTAGGTSATSAADQFTYTAPSTTASTMDLGSDRPTGTVSTSGTAKLTAVLTDQASATPNNSMVWSAPHNITGDSDVSTTGTLVSAVSVANSSSVTVNGVTFQPMAPAGTSADGFFTWGNAGSGFNGFGGSSPPFTNLSSAYQSLLSSGRYGAGNSTLTLNNLTIGNTYQFTYWLNDSRGSYSQTDTVASGGSSTSVRFMAIAGSTGQYVTGTFTASATTQVISFSGDNDAYQNALMLRQVSQPVTPLVGKTVNFYDGACGTNQIGTGATTTANGSATINATGLSGGVHTITACFAGDGSYAASSSTMTLTVPSITLGAASLPDFGHVTFNSYSASQSTTISGANLSGPISCSFQNYNFRLSSNGSTWYQGTPLILTPTNGSYSGTLYVQFSPQQSTPGPVSGNVVCQSLDAAPQNLAVSGIDDQPPLFVATAPAAVQGQAYSQNIVYQGYPAPTCTIVSGDAIPSGLSLGSNCVLSGTPAAGTMGTYHTTVKASNGIAPDAQHDLTINIYGTPVITSADNTSVAEGGTLSFPFTATSNPQNVWQLAPGSDPLPSGVTFCNGCYNGLLSGTPALGTAGTYHLIVRANNGYFYTDQPFTLTITPPVCTPEPSGMYAWYRGEGDASDRLNTFPGTLVNGTGFAAGRVGQGFNLDGVDDAITVQNTAGQLGTFTSMSVDAWVNLQAASSGSGMIFAERVPLASGGFEVSYSNAGAVYLLVHTANSTGVQYKTADGALALGSLHHIAAVYDGSDATNGIRIYIDGQNKPLTYAAGPGTPTGNLTASGQVFIGERQSENAGEGVAGAQKAKGVIDELHIFGKALSSTEVQSIFSSQTSGVCNTNVVSGKPTSQAGAVYFSSVTTSSMTVNWGSSGAASYLAVMSTSPITFIPQDGSTYTVGQAYGGAMVVSSGANNAAQVNGLTPATTYYFQVFAYNGASGTESYLTASAPSSSQATAAPATHFSVSAPASATAGVPVTVTVTALDASNNAVSGYSGTVHFTSTDPAAILPGDSAVTNGTGTFSVTLRTVGVRTVTVTDTADASLNGTSGNISVNPAAASSFAVSAPSSATAGTSFNFTVTAKDAFGNTATGYAGTVHFTSTDAQSVLPANSTLSSGTGTFSGTLKTAGTQTISANDTVNGSIAGTSGAITVAAAAATHFNVTAPSAATAGSSFSMTITAADQFNNTATGYSGTVHFTSTDPAAVLPSNSTLTNGVVTLGATLKTAGSQTITATDTVNGSVSGTSGTINVGAAAASILVVTAPSTATAGQAFNVTVTAKDAFGNTATSYRGGIHFTTSDPSPFATLAGDYTFTAGDNGTHTFGSAASLVTPGNQTVSATDKVTSSITGTSGTIVVSPAAATHFSVTAPSSATSGTAFNITVTALDQFNNVATGYAGTVHFTSTDGAATLPANSTLTNGTGTFSVTLRTAGNRTVTATDTVSGATGTSGSINVSAGTVQFSGASFAGNESENGVVTITRSGDLSGTASVLFSTVAGGSAAGGATCDGTKDYLTVTNQSVSFGAGEGSKNVTVPLCSDNNIENAETINLALTSPSGASLGSPSTAVFTINDTASAYRNATQIDLNFGSPGAPYPSTINVTGAPTQIGGMRVTLYNVSETLPDNLEVLLVDPSGTKTYVLMASAGGPTPIDPSAPVTLTFSDTAADVLPDSSVLTTGQFKPTTWTSVSSFPAPAPANSGGTAYTLPGSSNTRPVPQTMVGRFAGVNPNGAWSLYVRDDAGTPLVNQVVGAIAGGWGIQFLAPTAAGVNISGRVRGISGDGLRNARVELTDSHGGVRTVLTNAFGYYTFEDVKVGETYLVGVASRNYTYSTRVVQVFDSVGEVDFTPNQ